MSINEKLEEIREEFLAIPEWRERYFYMLEIGSELTDLPESECTEETKVSGCISQVWLKGEHRDGRVYFQATSDSVFVKGLIAMLIEIYSGSTPEEILSVDPQFFTNLGIIKNLSPNRANGFASMLRRIHEIARSRS